MALMSIVLSKPAQKSLSVKADEIPVVELDRFTYYLLKEHKVDIIAHVKEGLRFETHDELNTIKIMRNDEQNRQEELNALLALYNRKEIRFPKGLDYGRQDGVIFYTEQARYDIGKETFFGQGPFELMDPLSQIYGENLVFDRKNGKIRAEKIMAQTETR